MKTIYARSFSADAYAHYLSGQWHLFSKLESLLEELRPHHPQIAVLYDEALHRTHALDEDLAFWAGSNWDRTVSAATQRYLTQLSADAQDPWLLLCHHFLQYNAALSGGQFLGKMVSARAAELNGGTSGGAHFYSFDASCQPTHGRVQQYMDELDKLNISDETRDRMLACMQQVYAALFAMFDEAYALGPAEGITFQNANAAGETAPPAAPAESGVPPPLEPEGSVFSLKELHRYDSSQSGMPLLTSLLGRVYDVSSGREFFGAGGPYEIFAGHDASYNLGVMSMKKATLDLFEYELDEEDRMTIAEWIAYFDNRYGRPVGLLGDKTHPIAINDLPRPKKIPFSNVQPSSHPALAQSAASKL